MTEIVTAAMIVIGDEILSGRTKDRNIGHLADIMTAIGIDLKEVRIVADDEAAIVEAVNALRVRHTYVFTSGGIGPTHDDITADSIAKAFGVPCEYERLEGWPHAMDLSEDVSNRCWWRVERFLDKYLPLPDAAASQSANAR